MTAFDPWQACNSSLLKKLSPNLLAWLIKCERLTEELKQTVKGYQFKVISENLREMRADEARLLNSSGQVWERRISHQSDAGEVVRASVVISAKTYTEFQSTFDNLKDQPIGNTLFFNNSSITRSAFEYSKIGTHWARRSIFHWNAQKIIVTEIFTDNLPIYQTHTMHSTFLEKLKLQKFRKF